MTDKSEKIIAVLLPCYNEATTIEKCVRDFRRELPEAEIYVFDNNSSDESANIAKSAGAKVIHSSEQGKGNVVRHMFSEIDADIYIMADADDTYPATDARRLIESLEKHKADMIVGARLQEHHDKAFRSMHKFGNKLISWLISKLFSSKVTDVLSGFRVFSKNIVNNMYLRADGFEIETEMTLQALIKNYKIHEEPINYSERPEGSISKLNTIRDGIQIFKAIFLIFKDYKPMVFFTTLSGISFGLGMIAGWFPIRDYLTTQYVEHVPLAILAASLVLLSALFLGIGLILGTVARYNNETHQLIRNITNSDNRIE